MLSALLWFSLFVAFVVAAMVLREHVRNDKGLRGFYERVLKDRLDVVKKIVIYGTIILWVGIWLATRGDDKASVSTLLKEISNSWNKPESQTPPPTQE